MDADTLKRIFENLGFGKMSDEDLEVLIESADGDGDGRVSLEDFRGIRNFVSEEEITCKVDDNKRNERPRRISGKRPECSHT